MLHVQMDVINLISKVDGLPDAPIVNPREEYQPAPMYYVNGCAALCSFLSRAKTLFGV